MVASDAWERPVRWRLARLAGRPGARHEGAEAEPRPSDPDSSGAGFGRQMVTAAEDWLRERGVIKAQLLVRDTNTRVVSFYEHLGFEVAPRVIMDKWLRATS